MFSKIFEFLFGWIKKKPKEDYMKSNYVKSSYTKSKKP